MYVLQTEQIYDETTVIDLIFKLHSAVNIISA